MAKEYLFLEHADAGFYGRGPWKIGEVLPSGWLKMIPVWDRTSPSEYLFVDPINFHLTFRELGRNASNS